MSEALFMMLVGAALIFVGVSAISYGLLLHWDSAKRP
jgi:hypothetical protein